MQHLKEKHNARATSLILQRETKELHNLKNPRNVENWYWRSKSCIFLISKKTYVKSKTQLGLKADVENETN